MKMMGPQAQRWHANQKSTNYEEKRTMLEVSHSQVATVRKSSVGSSMRRQQRHAVSCLAIAVVALCFAMLRTYQWLCSTQACDEANHWTRVRLCFPSAQLNWFVSSSRARTWLLFIVVVSISRGSKCQRRSTVCVSALWRLLASALKWSAPVSWIWHGSTDKDNGQALSALNNIIRQLQYALNVTWWPGLH